VWARNKGILGPAALFNGQNRILRRGAVAMVWGLMESPTGFPANGFVDVPGGATYGPALDWARAAGVVTAAGNRFRPNAALTRLQAANLLWRAAGSPAGNPSHGFSDVGNGNQAVRWARSALVLSGFANGTFRPNRPVTRTLLLTSIYHLALNPAAWSRPAPSTVLFPSLLG
jgi:hypothetical protein